MVDTSRQVGGSIGTALLNTLATSAAANYPVGKQPGPQAKAQAAVESYSTAYWWSALFYAVGLVATFALYRRGAPAQHSEGRAEGAVHMSRADTGAMAYKKQSAGLLLFRRTAAGTEVLLGHMGGPFWERRDAGAWTVPKGEYEDDEEPWAAARREFQEELGLAPPDGTPVPLGDTVQSGGKHVTVWAVEGDLDLDGFVPGTFTMEWPKGSGRMAEFPELDRAAWLGLDAARPLVVQAQTVFLDRLAEHV